ncbi:MAG: hypothetical protein ABFS08_04020 [Pseudomonadota bacterium]
MKRSMSPLIAVLALGMCMALPLAHAAQVADVASSKHNLATGPVVTTADTDRVCVFCHTPHGATADGGGFVTPLWNRDLSAQTYTLYDDTTSDALKGASIDAALSQPGGTSKLCLSCHDGTIAIGKVNVFNGAATTFTTSGTELDGTMPAGDGVTTGFTRDLGISLQNDHPISFTYDATLASNDGELYDPASVAHIDNRVSGSPTPLVPLESGEVQCTSCHDPHVVDDADPAVSVKFIREGLNRFQQTSEPGSDTAFDTTNDILCLACHTKAGWSDSAHALSTVANETYTATATTQRDFPAGIAVWQAACMNCHDTHTVQGARKLLREGTDDTNTPKVGGNPAQEETCYQCHDVSGGVNNILTTTSNLVPDIKSDFALATHMPIATSEQQAATEQHAITDKDFTESQAQLGRTNLNNRHAECTDCHNPHRVLKNRLFNDTTGTPDAAATHNHNLAAGETHSNIASGALSGTTGVEPSYATTTWGQADANITFTLKQGLAGASTDVNSTYVTREYQVCLKCHSNYAWPDDSAPSIGPSIGTNSVNQYTNQAMEFQAPLADKGESPGTQGAAANHRSWHPVMDNTGRTAAVRGLDAASANQPFLAPWNDATATNIGNQTMYCSDCHGSGVTSLTDVIPDGGEDGNPWGPHGSNNPFLLKGTWDNETGAAGATDSGICFKCHDWNEYGNPNNNAPKLSGFRATTNNAQCNLNFDQTNLHIGHAGRIGANLECTWCHAAVPHGWRNKALLVDITDADGCGGVEPCTSGPYYLEAYLGGSGTGTAGTVNWRASGEWTAADCGGRNWMNNTCANPQ